MDFVRRLLETIIFGGILILLGLATVVLAYSHIIDWNQATSMLWVETVVGIIIYLYHLLWRDKEAEKFAETYAIKKQQLELRAAKCKELENRLKKHYENDLLPIIREWFKPAFLATRMKNHTMDYSLLSGRIYYYPQNKSVVSQISEPMHFPKNTVEEVVKHLTEGYPEYWKKWCTLKDNANNHLNRIVKVWEEIEDRVKVKAKELGLAEWNGKKLNPPSNYYHADILVGIIWSDPEHYQIQKKHLWDEYDIHSDEKGGFEFGGTWAHSQKREILEKLKQYLTNESDRISGAQKNLGEHKSKLEKEGTNLGNFLKEIEDDLMRRYIRIRSFCPTCKGWLDELTELGA